MSQSPTVVTEAKPARYLTSTLGAES
jgi:hypothetical protein